MTRPRLSQLRRIAFRWWDPIGIRPADPAADDEYDSYLLRAVAMFESGAATATVAEYLVGVETEHMGLGPKAIAGERAGATAAAVRACLDRLGAEVRTIALDAAGWRREQDLWDALLGGLGAASRHGRNLDALWDSVTEAALGLADGRTINAVQPPFEVVVRHCGALAPRIRQRLHSIGDLLAEAKAELGLEVALRLDDG